MNAHTGRRSRLPLALIAALCLLLAGALAAAAATRTSSVTLNLQGGYANRQLTACSLKHHYTFFHTGNTITLKGSVAPAPASSWRVKVKVKQCLGPRGRLIQDHLPGLPARVPVRPRLLLRRHPGRTKRQTVLPCPLIRH